MSRREIAKRLAAIGEDIEKLDAVLVTHEHSDHTSGLSSLVKRSERPLPVFCTCLTAHCLDWSSPSARPATHPPCTRFEEQQAPPTLEAFQAGCGFTIGDFDVGSFTVPHDAADPVGYTLTAQGIKVAIATDLGYIPDSLRFHLRSTDVLLLEANHDLEMLRVGPYPWSVKQRVMSRRGHLSNEVACRFVRKDLDTCVSTLILGHISEHNNHPELVRNLGWKALDGRALFTKLVIAHPGIQSEAFVY